MQAQSGARSRILESLFKLTEALSAPATRYSLDEWKDNTRQDCMRGGSAMPEQ